MIINHTVSSLENPAAGTTYSVTEITNSVCTFADRVELFSVGDPIYNNNGNLFEYRFSADWPHIPFLNQLGKSDQLQKALLSSKADLFHIHGIWMLPNCYPALTANKLNKPLVLSPHGMLGKDALRYSRWKKKIFYALWQRSVLNSVDCFRATCDAEAGEIRSFGLEQPIAIIPNGIHMPPMPRNITDSHTKSVVSLGRIHPKKGLNRLIHAWALIEAEHPEWELSIVGPSEDGYDRSLKRLISQLGLQNVTIANPVYGDEKIRLLAEAEIFALPTLNENFAMTVAESLACCTPVISTKGAPWSGLIDNECGWWIDHGPEAMASTLREAMALSRTERRAMGIRGRDWMRRDFAWPEIGKKMADVYRWLLDIDERPDCVQVA